jgi:peptide deformylase
MLEIIKYPNPILREKALEIKNPTDPKIKQLVSEMVSALRAHDGLGLAAPQVGQSLRLCIAEVDHELFVLINPEIKKHSGDEINMEEGCLSFPGKFLPVKRSQKVKIKAFDSNGKKQIIRAKGLLARVLQHEIDHLNGVLLVDRANNESTEE